MTVPLLRVCYHCGYPTPGRHASSCPDADSGVVEVSKQAAPAEVAQLRAEVASLTAERDRLREFHDYYRDMAMERGKIMVAAEATLERQRPVIEAYTGAHEAIMILAQYCKTYTDGDVYLAATKVLHRLAALDGAWQPARPGDTPGELVPGEGDRPLPVDGAAATPEGSDGDR